MRCSEPRENFLRRFIIGVCCGGLLFSFGISSVHAADTPNEASGVFGHSTHVGDLSIAAPDPRDVSQLIEKPRAAGHPDPRDVSRLIDPPRGALKRGSLWRLVEVPIDSITPLDTLPTNTQRASRLRLRYFSLSSDRLALPLIETNGPSMQVDVTLRVWRNSALVKLSSPKQSSRVITLSLGALGVWSVRDRLEPTTQASVQVNAPPKRPCKAMALGACEVDCDCNEFRGERCLLSRGLHAQRSCQVPCEFDVDCQGLESCKSTLGAPPLVCGASKGCQSVGDCPPGHVCNSGLCKANFFIDAGAHHPCGCDADCAEPLVCVQGAEMLGFGRCQLPCGSAGAWCGPGHTCGTLGVQERPETSWCESIDR